MIFPSKPKFLFSLVIQIITISYNFLVLNHFKILQKIKSSLAFGSKLSKPNFNIKHPKVINNKPFGLSP